MLRCEILQSVSDIPADDWNALLPHAPPFLRHEFLSGLEEHNCLKPHGWYPLPVLMSDDWTTIAAMPLYVKTNSTGEFVFDWNWAAAYQRAGLAYYPKLVCAVPYVPATSPRFLLDPERADADSLRGQMLEAALQFMHGNQFSSLHCLFPTAAEAHSSYPLAGMLRQGCQYHWQNQAYGNFEDYLGALNSRHRKEIKRERRLAQETGVQITVLGGAEITEAMWKTYYQFYCNTFARKWGEPRYTLDFFRHLGRVLPENVLLFMAQRHGEYLAGAFALRDEHTLYGRHWGCREIIPQLHFEVCYYQTIEYCIKHGLQRLDAGAQGEHKLARGFIPQTTYSLHWLREAHFATAIQNFLTRETHAIANYITQAQHSLPFKKQT